tara:strand:- start:1206 stop:1433 length:228 start_codon:yes stop_codon:yes gene_type:complete
MRAFVKNLFGRNHRYSTPESKNVPKYAVDRAGSRSPVRQKANIVIEEDLDAVFVDPKDCNDGLLCNGWTCECARR